MRLVLLLLPAFFGSTVSAQPFDRHYGGNGFDRALFLAHTADKGYIACGYTRSFGSSYDMYLVKTNRNGEMEWHRNYGGEKMDIGWSIVECNDGYLLHGSTTKDSTNDDISIMRLDKYGNVTWQKTYGSEKYERATHVLPTSDGNYVLVGQRNIDQVNIDSYIFKIDTAGRLLWEKTFGGPGNERTYYGAETLNGDLYIIGSTLPYNHSKADILLLKLTRNGELAWTKTYGEENVHDIAHSFSLNRDKQTFTLTGYIGSSVAGVHDGLFMQLDRDGKVLTSKRHHTGSDVRLMHTKQTRDGGFISTGFTRQDSTVENHDAVLLKWDRNGKVTWMKTFGTPGHDDQGYWVVEDGNRSYTFCGYTHSSGEGGDLWMVRVIAPYH